MTNNKKLQVLVVILFCLILVLVGMFIYAKNLYDNSDREVAVSSGTTAASTVTSAADTSAADTSVTPEVKEKIELKLYIYDAEAYDKPKEIRSVSIEKELYQKDISAAINQLLDGTGIKINKAVVKDNLITVDLPKETALSFNKGSAGGITNTNILAMTMVNLPSVEKLEVTVDGVAGVVADHFNFNGIFSKSGDGSKYIFTESDKEGKELAY